MTTELIKVSSEKDIGILRAGELLRRGEVVAIPTETVYGLAANAFDTNAVKKIFAAKGRPQDNPLIVHIASLSALPEVVSHVPDAALRLAEKFWPGPLTMIMKKSGRIPLDVTAGLSTVAVRFPSHPAAAAIINAAQVPLAAPSANTSGKPSPTSAEHVFRDLSGKIPMIIDGGECEVGLESTVIDLSGDVPSLLRPGGVTLSQLRDVLGEVKLNPKVLEAVGEDEVVASPGMKYRHYAPSAPVIIVDGSSDSFRRYVLENCSDRRVAVLCFEEEAHLFCKDDVSLVTYGRLSCPEELAHGLFKALRELDDIAPDVIFARSPETCDGIELAVVNRLCRAAAFHRISL